MWMSSGITLRRPSRRRMGSSRALTVACATNCFNETLFFAISQVALYWRAWSMTTTPIGRALWATLPRRNSPLRLSSDGRGEPRLSLQLRSCATTPIGFWSQLYDRLGSRHQTKANPRQRVHFAQPDHGASEVNEAHKGGDGLLAAQGDTAEALELVEEGFDLMAFLVEPLVDRWLGGATGIGLICGVAPRSSVIKARSGSAS